MVGGFMSGVENSDAGGGSGGTTTSGSKPRLWKGLVSLSKSSSSTKAAPTGGSDSGGDNAYTQEFKKGGRVRKTGLAKVHKGERVLTRKQARKYAARKKV